MNKMLKTAAMLVGLTLAGTTLACSIDGHGGFLPENDLRIPVGQKVGGITQDQFLAVIDKIEAIYSPVISGLGAKLKINRKWTNATVNANASQSGKTWNVNMYGGLARHSTITEDGFALVLCHEIGHHIGGAPKKAGGFPFKVWASNEGQSDYFANLKCLRQTFLNDDNTTIVSDLEVPKALADACKEANKRNKEDTALCIRGSMAGKSVAALFSSLRNIPEAKFDTPDSNVVSKTNDSHPAPQCRLDTYFNGSLCEVGMNEPVSDKDEVQGTCHPSLGNKIGNRPLCWFKPSKG